MQGSSYHNDEYSQDVSVKVTSASSGDTLKEWVEREKAELESTFAEKYREISDVKETTAAGVPAIEVSYSHTMGGDKREIGYSIHLIKDKYKYEITISSDKDEDPEEIEKLIKTVTSSLRIEKDWMDSELGFIQDIDELLDKNRTVTFTNEKYKYKLNVPEIWSHDSFGKDKDQEDVKFRFTGGNLSVEADTKKSFEDTVKDADAAKKKNSENDSEYKYTSTDETLFGVSGKKYVIHYSTSKIPYQETVYIFRKNNMTYTVTLHINEAVRAADNEARLNKAFESLTFLN